MTRRSPLLNTHPAQETWLRPGAAGSGWWFGAGIAGLASAYELGKAGHECTILEAKDCVGGCNWTVRDGTTLTDLDGHTQTARFSRDQYMNAGPARCRSPTSPSTTAANWACRCSRSSTRTPTR
jgi:predicted NAD/FAD-dependent oxidoreductase